MHLLLIRACFVLLVALHLGAIGGSAQKICDAVSIGHIPLTQMTSETWNGVLGGLYPGGSNLRPFEHDQLLQEHSLDVKACRPNGMIDNVDGKIVVLGIGASNAWSAFNSMELLSSTDTLRNRSVRFLNVAQRGLGLQNVASVASEYWTEVASAVTSGGYSSAQVQVAWVMLDDSENTDTVFPRAAQDLADQLYELCKTVKVKFPSVKFIYLSSRPYSGYIDPTETTLGMGLVAPRDYIHGWAVKLLIERQINERDGYAFSGMHASLPALVWSSYLWADGTTANSNGLSWECSDFESDGYSLTVSGSVKAGRSLHASFAQDQLSKGWFTSPTAVSVEEVDSERRKVVFIGTDGSLRITATDGDVVVMNLQGKIMLSVPYSPNEINIATTSWPSGVYVVRSGPVTEMITIR
ncbi:MAG: hypothetical protein IPF59_11325 [Ignavibacteria bacterium]|nr:hypothetical protein [Ignavibacteria bacterium]